MTGPPELVLKLTLGLRVVRLVAAGLFLLSGGYAQVDGNSASAGFQFGCAGANIALFFMSAAWGVVLDAEGITLHGFTTRQFAWREVHGIEPTTFLGDRRVRIDLMDGTSVRAWSPFHSWMAPDPEFDAQLAAMQRYHRLQRRELARQAAPPPPTPSSGDGLRWP